MAKSIVTIGRQYGSGGREIGRLLAERMGVPYYDRELIELAAQEGGIHTDLFTAVDEKPTNSLLYTLATGSAMLGALRYTPPTELPLNDKLFILSSKVIRELAAKGSCVIIGRCADYVLRDTPGLTTVFIHAARAKRVQRAVEVYGVPAEKAESSLNRMDKQRASYYSYYTGRTWSALENYHLCIDGGMLSPQGTADVIEAFVKGRGNV